MAASSNSKDSETTARVAKDGYISIEFEKEQNEPVEENKKATNGLVVSLPKASMDKL